MSSNIHPIDWKRVDILIDLALEEDLGENGDITTNSVIPADLKAKAVLLAKQDLVIAGLPVAERLFQKIDPTITFVAKVQDGAVCKKGDILAEMYGSARALLTGERTALNFIQRLSGSATMANKYQNLAGDKAEILDTRKICRLRRWRPQPSDRSLRPCHDQRQSPGTCRAGRLRRDPPQRGTRPENIPRL